MTKLEDKLLASVNKPAQTEKVNKVQTAGSKTTKSVTKAPAAKTKARVKQKPVQKSARASLNTKQSALFPQRIWPD